MNKGETIYTLPVLEKRDGETPLHSLAKPFVHEFGDIYPSDLPLGLPSIKRIKHQIDLFPFPVS